MSEDLMNAYAEGSSMGNLSKSRKYTTFEECKASIDTAYQVCSIETPVTVEALAEYIGVSPRCVCDRLKEVKDEYWGKGGIVGKIDKEEKQK